MTHQDNSQVTAELLALIRNYRLVQGGLSPVKFCPKSGSCIKCLGFAVVVVVAAFIGHVNLSAHCGLSVR